MSEKQRKSVAESNRKRTLNLTGQKFNRLTAISLAEQGKWNCLCDCGSYVLIKTAHLRNNNSKSCGCLQKEKAKASITKRHVKSRASKGLAPDQKLSTEDVLDRLLVVPFAKEVRKRDNYCCTLCLSRKTVKLSVHHLEPFATRKDLRLSKSNLVTLCHSCHLKTHDGNWWGPVNQFWTGILQAYCDDKERPLWQLNSQLLPK